MYGEDSTDMPLGTKLLANMDELMVGWIRWQDNKPTDHVMGRVSDNYQPPRRDELGDRDKSQWEIDGETGRERDPWQFSNYLLMLGDEEGDEPQLFTFTTSSRGGLNAIGSLCTSYGKVLRQKPDQFPVIKTGTGSYMHSNKSYGRIKFPTLEIVGWLPKSAFPATGERDVSGDEIAKEDDKSVADKAAAAYAAAKNKRDVPATAPAPGAEKGAGRAKGKTRF
jgi:hypothetical protein